MSGYDLIAFDMDGTLLTSKNKVSESSREAIARAVELGKRIAVCTGRAVGEIEPYEENELQNVRYLCVKTEHCFMIRRQRKFYHQL